MCVISINYKSDKKQYDHYNTYIIYIKGAETCRNESKGI